MTRFHKYMASAVLAVMPLCALAQTNGSNSPYSRYGLGLLSDGGNAFNKGMSGTAYGMRYGAELNTKNPASYAAIDSLSMLFDFGVSLQNGNFSQQGVKTNAKNTSIDYVTAGLRMAPRLGLSIGLVPFSTIGYESSYTQNISGSNLTPRTQTTTYSGDGGLHEVYVGIGWAPVKPLSVGFNAGYLWGDLTHTSVMTPSEGYSNRQMYNADIRTYKFDVGVQYEQRLNKKNSLTLGLVYGLGHDINRSAYYYNQSLNSSSLVVSGDTAVCRNAYQLPHTVGVGLTWTYKKSLRLGADYTFQKWSSVKSLTVVRVAGNKPEYQAQKGYFSDMHKVSLGVEYIPNDGGVRWRQHVRYRAGLAFSTPYIKVDGQDGPKDFQASLGVALPIVNRYNNRTFINFSAQYEQVTPKISGMVKERYLRLSIGLTFNERWFMKWKAE